MHSPREIVLKRSVDFDLHCRADFGQYIHTHIEPEKSNDMNGRTFAALYLVPTGNLQGPVKAWDINTGCVKKVKVFGVVLMPNSVVDAVNKWGMKYQKEKKEKMGICMGASESCFPHLEAAFHVSEVNASTAERGASAE